MDSEEVKEALPLPAAVTATATAATALPPLPFVPSVVPRLVKFKAVSASTWTNWKGRTRRALEILQVWDHVDSDLSSTRPDPLLDPRMTPAHLAAWDHAERIALAQILHNIDDSKLTITRKCATARAAWVALETNFVQASITSRMSILNKINQYSFEPESTVLDHTNRLRALCDDLEESGGTMPHDQLILYLLNSMPEEYEQTVVFLRMQPPALLTLDHVSNMLMAAETTFATKKRKTATSYITQTNGGGGGGQSHSKTTGGSNHKVVCSLCDKTGHAREKCFQNPKVGYPEWWGSRPRVGETNKQQKGGIIKKANKRVEPCSPAGTDDDNDGSSDDEASKRRAKKVKGTKVISFHTTVDSPGPDSKALMAFLGTLTPPGTSSGALLPSSTSSQWVLDSGTTSHFCKDRSVLMDLTEIAPVTVRMGSATTTAHAKGKAVLWVSKDGEHFDQRVTLGNVLYVPDFSVNLMSVRKLARAGFGFHVMGNTAQLTMADHTPFAVVHGNDRDDLYVIEARTSMSCPAADNSDAGADHIADSETSAGGDESGTVCMSTVSSDVASVQTSATTDSHDVTPLHLMHDRLNHLNVRQMVQMRSADMVDGAHLLPSSISSAGAHLSCESCIMGKSHRATMPRFGRPLHSERLVACSWCTLMCAVQCAFLL